MEKLPQGYKKMDLVLTFKTKLTKVVEMEILYFLIRDYYLFYSKVDKFDDGEFMEFHFYCRPSDEVFIAYRFGCYAQALLDFYPKEYFKNPIHTVPKPFPGCIEIELKEEQT